MDIKQIAAEHGFSLYALSRKAGVSGATLHKQQRRGTGLRMRSSTLQRLAQALGMSVEELLARLQEQEQDNGNAAPNQQ